MVHDGLDIAVIYESLKYAVLLMECWAVPNLSVPPLALSARTKCLNMSVFILGVPDICPIRQEYATI